LGEPTIPNAADLYLGRALAQIDEMVFVIPHPANWIRVVEGEYHTIWHELVRDGGSEAPQVDLLNELLTANGFVE
jgi:hypothetical protein